MFKRLAISGAIAMVALVILVVPALAGAVDNSGRGMNRESERSEKVHGNDPGQDQGSPKNTADPDCTGNRTHGPQATNIGECDAPTEGAPDKPGGSGGFDADKDWNNGCGNDMDREDDNNGHCGKPAAAPVQPPSNPGTPPSPPKRTEVLGESFTKDPPLLKVAASGAKSTAVLGAQFERGALPRTGSDSAPTLLIGMALIGCGVAIVAVKMKALVGY